MWSLLFIIAASRCAALDLGMQPNSCSRFRREPSQFADCLDHQSFRQSHRELATARSSSQMLTRFSMAHLTHAG
jgi:hypothetical protein